MNVYSSQFVTDFVHQMIHGDDPQNYIGMHSGIDFPTILRKYATTRVYQGGRWYNRRLPSMLRNQAD